MLQLEALALPPTSPQSLVGIASSSFTNLPALSALPAPLSSSPGSTPFVAKPDDETPKSPSLVARKEASANGYSQRVILTSACRFRVRLQGVQNTYRSCSQPTLDRSASTRSRSTGARLRPPSEAPSSRAGTSTRSRSATRSERTRARTRSTVPLRPPVASSTPRTVLVSASTSSRVAFGGHVPVGSACVGGWGELILVE